MQAELSDEIVEEIFTRLPVKSLQRAKSVCKAWRDMISSHHFAKLHFRRAKETHRSRLLRSPLFPVVWDNEEAAGVTAYEFAGGVITVVCLAYCSGLYLIDVGLFLYLWNPATRQSRNISYPRDQYPVTRVSHSTIFGLGYDAASDDYKVVRIIRRNEYTERPTEFTTDVFSVRWGTWRRIGDFPTKKLFRCPGVFANGKLHWMCDSGHFQYEIVTLDLQSETYGHIRVPDFVAGEGCFTHLAVLDDRVVLFFNGTFFDTKFWMLEQNGEVASWRRIALATVELLEVDFPGFQPRHWDPPVQRALVLFPDPFDHNEGFDFNEGFDWPSGYYIDYVESLVSPFTRFM